MRMASRKAVFPELFSADQNRGFVKVDGYVSEAAEVAYLDGGQPHPVTLPPGW